MSRQARMLMVTVILAVISVVVLGMIASRYSRMLEHRETPSRPASAPAPGR